MIRRPPRSTRTDTLFPYTTLFRSSAADERADLATRPEQALIYRLSGDYNPLHADPAVAAAAGLDRPILHGLCTYGIAGRALLAALCGNDPARLARLDCRFPAPVFPGDRLALALWGGDRKTVGEGKRMSERVEPGGSRIIKNNSKQQIRP